MKTARLLTMALWLALLCGATAAASAEPTLDEAFRGEAVGRGRFKSVLIGLNRGFVIRTMGQMVGDLFVLDQLFRFDDGMTDRRTWWFKRTGPRSYIGVRRDVVGFAKVEVGTDAIRMSYDVRMRRKDGGLVTLHFEDRLSRLGPSTIESRAVVSTLGVPVGSVEAELVRTAAPAGGKQPLKRRD